MNDEYKDNLKEENILTEDGSSQIRLPDTDTDQFLNSLVLQTENESSLPIPEDVNDTINDTPSKNIMLDDIYIDIPEANIEEQLENKADTVNLNEELENKDDTAYLNKQLENKDKTANLNEQSENKDDITYLNEQLENKDDTANVNDQLVNKDDTANINVSEKSQIISEEQDEDNNKKVKFSDIDMGTRGQLEIHSDTHLLDVNIDKEKEQVSWKASADNIKSSIIFAPPNENLLSDADESWPENIPSPVLRPSESISRSVTSLGRILETEEKFLISSESDDVPKNYKEKVDQKIRNTIESLKTNGLNQTYENKETDDKITKKKRKHESKEKTTEGLQKSSFSRDSKKLAGTKKASPPKTTGKIERPKELPKVDNKKHLYKYSAYNNEVTQNKLNKPAYKQQPHEDSHIERAKSNKETSRNQGKQHKRDYKVNEATAPNWLKHKRADVHEDLTFGMNQYEIRKWCKDLDREFGRFEIWNDWLKCMSRNFINLHQSQALSRRVTRCDFKRWIKFQRNLDKNVCTWAKLHRRTQHRLNQTIYICVKPSEIASPKRYPSPCLGRSPKKSPPSPHCSTYRKYF
ncbi:uncharacterized protein PF11_0213 [Manduca sexta]|uniref:uncharacterized protein PF11_0213 n=1 Tax=Manduca sexta TaxID=7130 RepID=UPI00188E54CD|nr:uncharacterized protein PF11_0213 [Manduca sexta]